MSELVDVTVYLKHAKKIHWDGANVRVDGTTLQFSLNNKSLWLEAKSLLKKLKIVEEKNTFDSVRIGSIFELVVMDFNLDIRETGESAGQEGDDHSDIDVVDTLTTLKRLPYGAPENCDSSKTIRTTMEKPKEIVKLMARPPRDAYSKNDTSSIKKELIDMPERLDLPTILENRNIRGQLLFGSYIFNSRIFNSQVTGATITNCTIENSTIIASTIVTDNLLE